MRKTNFKSAQLSSDCTGIEITLDFFACFLLFKKFPRQLVINAPSYDKPGQVVLPALAGYTGYEGEFSFVFFCLFLLFVFVCLFVT